MQSTVENWFPCNTKQVQQGWEAFGLCTEHLGDTSSNYYLHTQALVDHLKQTSWSANVATFAMTIICGRSQSTERQGFRPPALVHVYTQLQSCI